MTEVHVAVSDPLAVSHELHEVVGVQEDLSRADSPHPDLDLTLALNAETG